MKFSLLPSLFALLVLTGCAGYRLGAVHPQPLQSIHVPVFKNKVFVPHIQEQVSNAVIRQFQLDGTIHIAPAADAQAVLNGEIIGWERQPLRYRRGNLLTTREYRLVIAARVTVTDQSGTVLVNRKRIEGETTYFIADDQVAAERQATPLAIADLANNIVTQVVEGW